LTRAFDALSESVPLAPTRVVRAIEVAIDFRSIANKRAELEALTLRLKRNLAATGDKELECGVITDRVSNVHELRADRTLVIGAGEREWRVYLKDRDRDRPISDAADHRARVEVTLSESAIPAPQATLTGLALFRFESLTPLFSFRRLLSEDIADWEPVNAAEAVRHHIHKLAMRRGHRELPPPRKRERRKHHRLTRSDRELRERVRGALRGLSKRFCARKPGKSRC
jgi:hypothetical protein